MSDAAAATRVVLLGASNVKLALSTVVGLLEARGQAPLEILAACGHGRSYGSSTRVLGVEMPSIGSCGLWRALAERPPRATVAMLADAGNDIMYGASAQEIAAWIERDVDRLRAIGARPLLVRIPLVTIEQLSPWRYEIVRSILFPTRRISLDAARRAVRELDQRLVEIGTRRDLSMVEPAAAWYGFDPIHIRGSRRASVWSEIVAKLFDGAESRAPAELLGTDRRALARARAESRRVFGTARSRAQPAARLASGTTISLF